MGPLNRSKSKRSLSTPNCVRKGFLPPSTGLSEPLLVLLGWLVVESGIVGISLSISESVKEALFNYQGRKE